MSSLRDEPLVDAADLAIPALDAARLLLGCALVRDEVVLRITEVEAYCWPDDTANHCRMGRTERNAPMWGPAGRAYVYRCYGIHPMLNVVCGRVGEGTAVLIRAAELVEGHAQVAARRGGRTGPEALAGPGRLGAALALDPTWSHHDLCAPGGLELRRGPAFSTLLAGPRIGIGYATPADQAAPWRLAAADCAWVSHRKPLRPVT
jgi:DNA-3-methyladenine glycosylase